MNFEVTNGSNHISIGISGIGSYFRYDDPLSVVWYDYRGSVGKYFCLLPYNKEYRDALQQRITENLYKDFTGDEATLYTILEPLFSLFANGKYSLRFYGSNEFFRYRSSHDNYAADHCHPVELYFTEVTDINEVEQVKAKHSAYLESIKDNDKYYPAGLLDHTTADIYDSPTAFYATEPYAVIDEQRVQFFKAQISKGERPFAVIITAKEGYDDEPPAYYVLDGHHKLLAYQQLGIAPPVALVTYLPGQDADMDFDLESLSKLLFPWQVAHIIDHWHGKDEYLRKVLVNPASNLHRFVRNGHVKEYHENGVLKLEGYYINHHPEGKIQTWHLNGQLESVTYYKNGKRADEHQTYFDNGMRRSISRFDENGQYHGTHEYYYANGQKAGESHYEHGRNKEMIPHTSWHQDGKKSAEIIYRNGKLAERKNWNEWGDLLNHEILNEAGELQKTVTPSSDRYHQAMREKYNLNDGGSTGLWYYARIVIIIVLGLMVFLTMLKSLTR